MPRAKKHAAHENHERWLVSYADFITLLFAFFVVMFASSQTDKAKAKQVSESVKEALENGGVPSVVREVLGGTVDEKGKGNAQMRGPGGARQGEKGEKEPAKPETPPPTAELLPSMQYLTRELAEEIKTGKIQMRLDARGLVISLREAAFFASGDDTINAASVPSIGKMAVVLRSLPNPVRLEGHTDSVPIHTERFRNNWELSASRSIAMLELLTTRFEIPAGRFAVAGYADTIPLASNDTEEGRAHNRRVDIVILNRSVAPPDSEPKAEPLQAGPKAAAPKHG